MRECCGQQPELKRWGSTGGNTDPIHQFSTVHCMVCHAVSAGTSEERATANWERKHFAPFRDSDLGPQLDYTAVVREDQQ